MVLVAFRAKVIISPKCIFTLRIRRGVKIGTRFLKRWKKGKIMYLLRRSGSESGLHAFRAWTDQAMNCPFSENTKFKSNDQVPI